MLGNRSQFSKNSAWHIRIVQLLSIVFEQLILKKYNSYSLNVQVLRNLIFKFKFKFYIQVQFFSAHLLCKISITFFMESSIFPSFLCNFVLVLASLFHLFCTALSNMVCNLLFWMKMFPTFRCERKYKSMSLSNRQDDMVSFQSSSWSHRFCSLILDVHFHAGSHKQFTNICAIFNNLLQCMNKKHIITFLHCQVLNKWSLISFGSWTSLMVWWNQLYPPRKTHIYKHFCTKKFWCLLPNMEGPWSSS